MRASLAVLNALAGATLLAWPLLFYASIFLFDAPGSEENPVLVATGYAVWYYPAGPVLGNLLFWENRHEAEVGTLIAYTLISYSGLAALAVLGALLFVTLGP